MKSIANCPPTDELRELLNGSMPAEQQAEVTQHMDSCSGCQAKLESIATEGTNLSRVVEGLHQTEPLATSAYWPALRTLDLEMQPAAAATPAATTTRSAERVDRRTKDVSLAFLQPPSDTAYLGRLAQFDVMRVIGRGGMGVVLEAFDSRLQRNVAIKVLDPDLTTDETSRKRFCREARAAASISHENVVAVHQVETSTNEDVPFLVMQLIGGESLEQRLTREKKLPLREIVRIGMQAARGLAAAHAQGLIHRDIKPGNILLEPPLDTVKLTDFGLARAAEDVKLTRTGFVAGTPMYMAPEQALGSESDPRSDLFSLGAVLYEMCAGQPPFTGNSALAILKQISDTKHRPVRELNPAIPDWFAETIDELLEKKPEDRFQTAAHLAELLEFQWAMMKTTSDELPTVCEIERKKRTRRNRLIAAGVGVTFLSLGLLGGWLIAHRGEPAAIAAPADDSSGALESTLSANSGAVWSVAFNPDRQSLAMAVEDGSVRIWDLATKSVGSTFNAHRGTIWSVRFARGGGVLATAGDDGLIKLWKVGESEPFKTFNHPNAVRGMALSRDGETLFAGDRGGGLRVWPLDADKPAVEAQQPGTVYAMALSSDDETLATAGSDKIVRLWNAKTLSQKLPLEGHTGPIYGLSFNNDGRRLASAGWDQTVRVWDARSGLLVKSWEGHGRDIWSVAYSPDGKRLATGDTDGAVKLWNPDTGELLATYLGHKSSVHTVSFNQDGSQLASGGRDGAVRIWKTK